MTLAPQWVLMRLKWLAKKHGFRVTSGSGGKHNIGSLHPLNRAIDVSVKDKTINDILAFKETCSQYGLWVRDERVRPKGQLVWSGPHLHIEDRHAY
jgi:hypothetical protein